MYMEYVGTSKAKEGEGVGMVKSRWGASRGGASRGVMEGERAGQVKRGIGASKMKEGKCADNVKIVL